MVIEGAQQKSGTKKAWAFGIVIGVIATAVTVLASGFMIETTNTDTFCVSCHVMTPFRTAWRSSVHGGQNPQGFAAQCVDCHLPHGDFVEYLTAKAITGTGDVIQNFTIVPVTFDWGGNAKANRTRFTYDSACRRCHHNLTPPGLPSGGLIAHRSYLRGTAGRQCVECHEHVGHKDMLETANNYFNKL